MKTAIVLTLLLVLGGLAAAPTASAEDPDPRPMDCEIIWEPVYVQPGGFVVHVPSQYKCYH